MMRRLFSVRSLLVIALLAGLLGAGYVRLDHWQRDRYPHLIEEDQEAVRQYAVAALAFTQAAAQVPPMTNEGNDDQPRLNTALIQGIRQIAMNVRELDIDLIDRQNPFDAAYAILAKAMDEKTLKQVQAVIAAKKLAIPIDEARELAKRALTFKKDRGRLPDINSADPWEQRMAQGVAALARHNKAEKKKDTARGK